jgi:hypothetical protein
MEFTAELAKISGKGKKIKSSDDAKKIFSTL